MVTKCLAGKEHPDLFLSIFKQTRRFPVTKRHLISILKRTVCSVSFALEKGNPRTEEPGMLQSAGPQRAVGT